MPSFILQMIALNCFGLLAAGIVGVMPATLAELFPTNVRYSGIGVSYNIGFAIFQPVTSNSKPADSPDPKSLEPS